MEYRKLPLGKHGEKLSVLGLGMGGIQKCSDTEIEQNARPEPKGSLPVLNEYDTIFVGYPI